MFSLLGHRRHQLHAGRSVPDDGHALALHVEFARPFGWMNDCALELVDSVDVRKLGLREDPRRADNHINVSLDASSVGSLER